MSLPTRQDLGSHINDPIFGARELANPLPKYRFPERENRPGDIYQVVSDELYLDGNARQNLATFCQTWEEPEVHKLMNLAIDKNMIDKTEYPQTAEIEIRCTHMLADLWNAPAAATTVGTSTIGSSEACMLGGMAAKWRWKARRKAQGKPTDKPNLVCGPVQVCWAKFCRYWEIEKREIPMRPGMFHMDVQRMLEAVDENTIAVVPTFGVTYTGQYEFVAPIAAALDDLQNRTGIDIDIHVDAASGGFLAPFVAPGIIWDFRLPRVKSISTSGHKYGLAPIGCGWVLWRETSRLCPKIWFFPYRISAGPSAHSRSTSRDRPVRSSPSTTTSFDSAATATSASSRPATTPPSGWPKKSASSGRSISSTMATPRPAFPRCASE